MKVKSLQMFLGSLRSAISTADSQSPVPTDLDAVSAGLESFAELDFAQFASFLRQAEQYRDSGAVAVPAPVHPGAEKVQAGLRTTTLLADKLSSTTDLDTRQITSEREKARKDLEEALTTLLTPLAINVTLKDDKPGFKANLESAELRACAARVRAALEGATDEESLNDPDRQQKLWGIVDGLKLPELKAVATELGAPAKGRNNDAVLAAIVERVTGIKPAATKAPRTSKKPAIDQTAVQQQAVKLKGLVEKSLDSDGLSNEEIESAISELKPMTLAELQAIAHEMGLEKAGTKKEKVLKTIREKLQEAEGARESIEV
jgi:hypothetical protein